ncbi:PAS domain-containing sensor histidine kinase [Hymenobacter latericus]|uniref:PAS domain-containing sensor histidine kinase n=1 Tax=Hymenobacter sp. YIM 151858-1 TaxID=2987688 RepID=UPI0022274CE0|nr:PAS domain S-box protein [Hymenobacter sp. YIM 151858-1]UYZ57897.1 PAS domain S-box protein [Hymenobacter sp. YIM 151858-1]
MLSSPASFPADVFPPAELLHTVLDAVPYALVLYTPVPGAAVPVADLAFAYLNPAAQRLLGLPAQPATTYRQQFSATAGSAAWAAHQQALLAEAGTPYPLCYPTPTGAVQASGQRVGAGLLVRFADAAAPQQPTPPDEHPERQADEHSRQLRIFDTILEGLQEYVYLFDLEGRFQYVNKPLLDLWGLRLEQAVGKNFFDLEYPAALAGALQTQIQQVIDTRQTVEGETPYTSPTGDIGYYEYAFVPLLAPDGTVEAVAGRTQPVTERRRAEAALRISETKYRTIIESIDEGFCIIEVLFDDATDQPVDYRFVEMNPVFEKQTGMQGALGKTMRELVPGIETFWITTYGQVARTGAPVRFESHAESMGRWFDAYAFRIGEPQQRHVAILFSDITERKGTEEALRKGEEQQAFLLQLSDRLRPLVDAAEIQFQAACALGQYLGANRVGYAEVLPDGQTVVVMRNYTNGVPGIEGRYHFDDYGPALLQELQAGRTVVRPDIAHDASLTQAEKQAHAALQLGATVNLPLMKGGELVAVLFVHYQQAHQSDGDELALLTETAERTWAAVIRARTEDALRRSEERLQRAISIETVGVMFFNFDGTIHDANEAFQRMSGYTHQDFVSGRVRWDEITAPEFMPATRKAVEQLRTLGESSPYEKQYLRPDGTRWWGLFAGKRLSENEFVKFVVDITESKQAEQQLHLMNEQLQRVNVDLDNFIYTASHDLKAPIANIEGLLNLMQDHLPAHHALTPELQPLLQMMQDSVARFQRTIEYLSDVVKLQKEHDQPTTDVPLGPVIDDVCLDLAPLITESQATLAVDVAGCPSISFSAKNLRSVVYNLLSNALKYRHPERPPCIRIACELQERFTVLHVHDNGLGLDAQQQQELFGMFRRLHHHVAGSGLGLYMVKRSVENAGGKVAVHSQPGVGSTFSVYFRR